MALSELIALNHQLPSFQTLIYSFEGQNLDIIMQFLLSTYRLMSSEGNISHSLSKI